MPDIIKPNLKAVVWLGIGFFIAPKVIAFVQSRRG